MRELVETNDKRFWHGGAHGSETEARTAPLWKGESFDQYDPSGVGERTCRVTPELLKKVRKPRPGLKSLVAFKVPLTARKKAVRTELERARVAFRDVTNRTNSRTILACLILPGVFLTNTAPELDAV